VEPIALRGLTLDWSRPYLVGVVNATPDSFSDGGLHAGLRAAVEHGKRLAAAGADILDIGGESTRPGAVPVPAEEELRRVVPVIRVLARELEVPISVDTTKAEVARAALDAGAQVVNDVAGGRFDPEITRVTAAAGGAYVLGHLRGDTLAEVHDAPRPSYDQVVAELGAALAGLPGTLRDRTIVDPGLGFGKGTAENLELTRRAGELGAALGCAVMLGPSRKRFLGELTGAEVGARDHATVGAALAAVACGAHLVRVHDVAGVKEALAVFTAVTGAGT
jgi:dihydropteroate synthase